MPTLHYIRIFVLFASSLLESTAAITVYQKRFTHSCTSRLGLTKFSRMSTSRSQSSTLSASNAANDIHNNDSFHVSSSSPSKIENKIIAIIRHGKTECNEYLHNHEWGCQNFKDPELWDTVLSAAGRKQAGLLNYKVINSNDPSFTDLLKAELIVSSPLTRALHTTELALENTLFDTWSKKNNNENESNEKTSPSPSSSSSVVPKIVLPLAAERVYLSSDVGRTKSILQTEFPAWDFSLLHPVTTAAVTEKAVNGHVVDSPWWYRNSNFKEASRTRTRIPNAKYMDDLNSSSSTSSSTTTTSSSSSITNGDGSNHGDHSPSKRTRSSSTTISTTTSIIEDKNTAYGSLCLNSYLDTSEYIEWRPKGYYAAAGEPFHHFRSRMIELRKWLVNRPEKFIILTCHWGVARALMGVSMLNCEVKYINVDDILLEPYIDNNE